MVSARNRIACHNRTLYNLYSTFHKDMVTLGDMEIQLLEHLRVKSREICLPSEISGENDDQDSFPNQQRYRFGVYYNFERAIYPFRSNA